MNDYIEKELKPYKGYGISKLCQIDEDGKRIPNTTIYNVSEGEDYIGEEFSSLQEAKRFIDGIA